MRSTPRGSRLLVALCAMALVATAFAAVPAGAQDSADRSGPVLERDMRGEEAIRALGDRLPGVAAQNGMTAGELRTALRADSMLWVDRTGQLLFVDEFTFGGEHDAGQVGVHDHERSGTADGAWTSASMPAGTDVFALDSRPAARRVIVLDFTGHDARGTAWGSSGKQVAGAYDSDGDPSTFGQTEREQIYSVWQRVAEDYAPFDVNVTTRDHAHQAHQPGHPAIRRDNASDEAYGTRVVITPSQTYSCRCGGVAYVGVFPNIGADHDYYQPAWVFTGGVGNGAKNIAEAVSHEAGHNLNLRHDGTSSTGYYKGHGNWAPIMGVGYYEPISQWSMDTYAADANNPQDDLAVMHMKDGDDVPRGIVFSADEDPPATAALGDSGTVTYQGVIGTALDTDTFTFSTGGGSVSIAATPAAVSPNLDLGLRLVGTGVDQLVDPSSASSSGNDTSLGLDASLALELAAGTYAVTLDGVGFGDALVDGYTDYGSVGRYTLTISVGTGSTGDDGTTENQPPTVTASAQTSKGSSTVSFLADGQDPERQQLAYSWIFGDGGTSTEQNPTYTYGASGEYTATVTVTDGAGATATASVTVKVGTSTKGGGNGNRPPKAR